MPSADTKANGQSDFNDNEEGLDDETSQEDPMLGSVQDTDAEVLDTNENSADKVRDTANFISQVQNLSSMLHRQAVSRRNEQKEDSQEHCQKPAVEVGMAVSVENRQQNQTRSTRNRE